MGDYLPYLGDVLAGIATGDSAQREQDFPSLLQAGAQIAWDATRAQVVDELRTQIGKPRKDFTLRDIDLRLAKEVKLARAPGGSSAEGDIPLQLRLAPDLLIATSTTPSAFGSYADPRFSLDFGVAIDFALVVEAEKMSLSTRVDSAHITGTDFAGAPHLDSQNFVADVGKFLLETVLPWFGEPDLVAVVESAIARQDFAGTLTKALQPVNDLLGQLAKQGMGSIIALFPDTTSSGGLSSQALALGGTSSNEAPLLVLARPLEGEGVVRGEIRWPKSAGAPQLEPPYADAFVLSATADTGAAVGEFAQATNVTHLGGFEYAGTDGDHVIRYTLTGLPIDKPISVECAGNAKIAWTGDAANKIASPERDGWQGRVTIHPGVKVSGRFHEGRQRLGSPGEEVELNPQPIPPGRGRFSKEEGSRMTTPAAQVELNPQPIPPGRAGRFGGIGGSSNPVSASELGRGGEPLRRYAPEEESHVSAQAVRQDPSGAGAVDGINFVVHLLDKPH